MNQSSQAGAGATEDALSGALVPPLVVSGARYRIYPADLVQEF